MNQKRRILISVLFAFFLGATLITMFYLKSSSNKNNNNNRAEEKLVSIFHYSLRVDDNSPIYQELKSKTGTNLKVISSPYNEWVKKLSLMAASNSLPDIFITLGPGYSQSEKLAKDGVLLNISPYLKKFPNIQKQLELLQQIPESATNLFIPIPIAYDKAMAFRQDKLNEVGILTAPNTTEQFYQAAKLLKKAYPDIFPITAEDKYNGGLFSMSTFFYAFGGAWYDWLQQNLTRYGYSKEITWAPAWISEGNRRALLYINMLYQERLLDPEFFANSKSDAMNKFYNGKAFILFTSHYPRVIDKMQEINSDALLSYSPVIYGPEGYGGIKTYDFFTAVSLSYKLNEEEALNALKFLDYIYSPEGRKLLFYGVENLHYKYTPSNSNNSNGTILPLLPYNKLKDIDGTASLNYFIGKGDYDIAPWNKHFSIYEDISNAADKFGRGERFFFDTDNTIWKAEQEVLADITFRWYDKIITSPRKEFQELWNSFTQEFLTSGGDDVINERHRLETEAYK